MVLKSAGDKIMKKHVLLLAIFLSIITMISSMPVEARLPEDGW
jgi:hypothetical protein